MSNSTDKILQELEEEQIRRATLTKEDLQKSYLELEEEKFPSDKRIKFIADLGSCKEIAYHYELICKDWKEDKKLHIENSFDRHGSEGIDFLFEQLAKIEDEKIRIFTAFLLAEVISKLKHREFYSSFCNQLIPILKTLLNTNDEILRRKIIIAFGWVGTSKEIDLLILNLNLKQFLFLCTWNSSILIDFLLLVYFIVLLSFQFSRGWVKEIFSLQRIGKFCFFLKTIYSGFLEILPFLSIIL